MRVITGTREFQIEEPTAVTIGKFDGRHKGHQKLLREMLCFKERQGLKAAVFTFDMAPSGVMRGQIQTVITTNQERRNKMAKVGIDYLVEYPFDQETAHMQPEDFVSEVLVRQMHAKAVVVGTDCSFGYKGKGNVQLLKEMSKSCGFEAVIIEKEQDDHRDISSTYVREELEKGNMEKVNELLGYVYFTRGEIVHGRQLGRTIGVPTANLIPPVCKKLPPNGVYITRSRISDKIYQGITNVGYKPTVAEHFLGVETYLFDCDEDLYGQDAEVRFYRYLRPERKFASLQELKGQLDVDVQKGRDFFKAFDK